MKRLSSAYAVKCGLAVSIILAAGSHTGVCQTPLHTPTAAERNVLTQYRDTIHKILDAIPNENWAQDPGSRYDIDDDVLVSNDPDVPLDIDELIERTYHVQMGSPYYQRELAPILAKVDATDDPMEKIKIASQIKTTRLTITVHFNRAGVNPPDNTRPGFKVPGANMAFRNDGAQDSAMTLLFGDWSSAKRSNESLLFHFKKKGRYLAIENIVFEMHGSAVLMDELLKNIDWNQVNSGLYPGQ